MEEDIKILEDETNALGLFLKCKGAKKYKKAIENILLEFSETNLKYKKLAEENNELKQAILINKREYQEVCNKNKELEEEIDDLKNDLYHDGLAHKYLTLKATSIPTSLIKEKIDELEEEKKYFYSDYAIEERNNKIQVLQELLRRRGETRCVNVVMK